MMAYDKLKKIKRRQVKIYELKFPVKIQEYGEKLFEAIKSGNEEAINQIFSQEDHYKVKL